MLGVPMNSKLQAELCTMLGFLVGMLKGVSMLTDDEELQTRLNKNIETAEWEIDKLIVKMNEAIQ